MLPAKGADRDSKPSSAELLVYVLGVLWFALGILAPRAKELGEFCLGQRHCRPFLFPPPWWGSWIPDKRWNTPGSWIDLADIQWRTLRASLPLLGGVAVGLSLAGRLVPPAYLGPAAPGPKIAKNFCIFLQNFGGLVLGCIKTKFCK